MRIVAMAVLAVAVPASLTAADKAPIPIKKGQGGFTAIPCGLLETGAVITDSPEGLRIQGKIAPSPLTTKPCLEYWVVREAKPHKESDTLMVELRYGGVNGYNAKKVYFKTAAPDLAFARLFVDDAERDHIAKEYRRRTREALYSEFFGSEPLSRLPDTTRGVLMAMAFDEEEGVVRLKLSAEEFKGQQYFVANMGVDNTVYNEEKLTQAQRLALLLNNKLLAKLREFEKLTRGVDALQGVKIELGIPHESFISKDDATDVDRLELYAPLAALRQFVAADVTAKKFLEGSVILINGNRMEVPSEL